MAYFVDASPAVGIPGEVHATQKNALGSVRLASDGYSYIYLKGVTSCADGSVVVFQTGVWTAQLAATGLKGGVAIATGAVDASTKFGWFLYIGQDTITVRSAVASNVPLFLGGVSGYVDDTAVKGDQVLHAFVRNAAGGDGGSAIIQINRAEVGFSNESTG
jgi:hypothetical protein